MYFSHFVFPCIGLEVIDSMSITLVVIMCYLVVHVLLLEFSMHFNLEFRVRNLTMSKFGEQIYTFFKIYKAL